jgi:hypothetical protein
MQKFFSQFAESDLRVVRKWRPAALGFYGSIVAGMLVYVALHLNPEVNYASVDSTARAKIMSTSGADGRAPFSP